MQIRWFQKVQDCSRSLRNIFGRPHTATAKTSSGFLTCCCRAQGMLEPLRQPHGLAQRSLRPFLLHLFPLLPLSLSPGDARSLAGCEGECVSQALSKQGKAWSFSFLYLTVQRHSSTTMDNLDPALLQLNQFPFQMTSQQCRDRSAARESSVINSPNIKWHQSTADKIISRTNYYTNPSGFNSRPEILQR